MTGLSPCLLGSLVVLIAAAGGQAATGKAGKYYPLVFGSGIITAYLVVAAVILGAGYAIRPDDISRQVIYGIAGLGAVFIGLVQLGLFSLPDRLGTYASKLVFRFRTLPGIFLLGIIFAVLFAPCAMAPFLILMETILLGNSLAPVLALLSFSLGIITPFIALFAFRNSIAEQQVLRYAGVMQKLGGLLLILFGLWLLLSL
jgi:cytochrome c biogenesis protein CcdA